MSTNTKTPRATGREARRGFSEIIRNAREGRRTVITHHGADAAAVVSMGDLARLEVRELSDRLTVERRAAVNAASDLGALGHREGRR